MHIHVALISNQLILLGDPPLSKSLSHAKSRGIRTSLKMDHFYTILEVILPPMYLRIANLVYKQLQTYYRLRFRSPALYCCNGHIIGYTITTSTSNVPLKYDVLYLMGLYWAQFYLSAKVGRPRKGQESPSFRHLIVKFSDQ